jgi:VanZ family protein
MEKLYKFHPIFATIAIVLIMIILLASLVPKTELPTSSWVQLDKLVHFGMYGSLSFFIFKGFFVENSVKALAIACILSFFYGFIVEFLQYFLTTTRMFDVFDIFANGIGTIISYLLVKKFI